MAPPYEKEVRIWLVLLECPCTSSASPTSKHGEGTLGWQGTAGKSQAQTRSGDRANEPAGLDTELPAAGEGLVKEKREKRSGSRMENLIFHQGV